MVDLVASKVSQSVNESIQVSLQQALADIRHTDEDVKSLIDDYGRYKDFSLQRLDIWNNINAVINCMCLV